MTTCGVIIHDKEKFLALVNYKKRKLDIPKGKKEKWEDSVNCVVRETFEETNLKIDKNNLEFLGAFPFKGRALKLYSYYLKNLPSLNSLKCNEMKKVFKDAYVPEISDYKYLKFEKIKHLEKDLFKIMKKIGF
jgi:8-oxo-dGTP pyrophosphatase MutT (NUDIX family)